MKKVLSVLKGILGYFIFYLVLGWLFLLSILLTSIIISHFTNHFSPQIPQSELIERGIGYKDESGKFHFHDIFKFAGEK
jgi:hypothetical protein